MSEMITPLFSGSGPHTAAANTRGVLFDLRAVAAFFLVIRPFEAGQPANDVLWWWTMTITSMAGPGYLSHNER